MWSRRIRDAVEGRRGAVGIMRERNGVVFCITRTRKTIVKFC